MKQRKAHRARLGALAIAVALPAFLVTAGAAQASSAAVRPGSMHVDVVHLRSQPAAGTPVTLATDPVSCPVTKSYCTLSTGWLAFPGIAACEVSTQVQWWRATDEMNLVVEVYSGAQFSSCTVYTAVWFGFVSGPPASSSSFWGFACGSWDLTCSDPQTDSYYNAPTGISEDAAQSVTSLEVTETSS
jgi:hypothetical protein